MDYYNEQLITKKTDGRDILLRVLIGLATLAVLALIVIGLIMFNFLPLIVIAAGALYLSYLLFTGTFTEYEYIVTNNDLDIDKISGRRKRKRLITVKLNTVTQWGEYNGGEGSGVDATVMASDASGYNAWYLLAETEKYGKVMVIFTPNEETVYNINHGVPFAAKKKLAERKEDSEEENDETAE